MSEFTQRMKDARNGVGVEQIWRRMLDYLPEGYKLSSASVYRMCRGDEREANPLELWAYAKACDVPLESLSAQAAKYFASSFWLYLRVA